MTRSEFAKMKRTFDDAADQANMEGVSSFGKVWSLSSSMREEYKIEANKRGVNFVITKEGIGLFVDDSVMDQYEGEYA